MKFNPKKLLKPRVIAWAASALVLAGVLIAANAVAVGEYGSLIDSVLGGKKAITAPRDRTDPSYKTKQQACEAYLKTAAKKDTRLLVLHTIDRYRFHWLDFYKVIKNKNGKLVLKKLKSKQAFFNKDHQPIDENGNIIPGNFKFRFLKK